MAPIKGFFFNYLASTEMYTWCKGMQEAGLSNAVPRVEGQSDQDRARAKPPKPEEF